MNTGDTDEATEQADARAEDSSDKSDEKAETKSENSSDKSDEEYMDEAKKLYEPYKEDRPTAVLPGSDGTVAGTAVNEWLDDDGNPIHGDSDNDSDAKPTGQEEG